MTLAELVIAIAVIGICVASIALMFQEALRIRGKADVRAMTIATALGEKIMENLTARSFADISSFNGTFSGFPGYSYRVAVYNVEDPNLDAALNYTTAYKLANVSVLYGDNQASNITLSSLFVNLTR